MSNDISGDFPEIWSKRQQVVRYKETVYAKIANFEEVAGLEYGDKVHRPYRSSLVVNNIGTDGAFTRQDITDTDESLTVDQKKEVTFYITAYDEMWSKYKAADNHARDALHKWEEWVDGDVLGEYDQADSTVAYYEISASGSASDGIGITLSTSNIMSVIGKVNKKMNDKDIPKKGRWMVISTEFENILWELIASKDTGFGDKIGDNGYMGHYAGFDMYLSTNTGWSARLEFGSQATDGDTVTVNGVAMRFKTTIAQAGDMLIDTDAEDACDAFTAIINDSESLAASTEGTLYWELTDANRALLSGITATDVVSYVTLKGEGVGYIVVSETLNAAADIWTTTKQLQHVLAGQGRPTDLVVQKSATLLIQPRSGYIGRDLCTWGVYGLKTFDEGDAALVDIQLRSDAY